jgi:hypothetical protein
MSAHGAPSGFGNVAVSADTDSGYRNLFGKLSGSERYTGFGSDLKGRERNREMLRWLAMRFSRPYDWGSGGRDNRRIPAGYTYLAQFVIHDTVQSLADLPDLRYGTGWMRNARFGRLVLDTIYGKGPAADPLFYEGGPAAPQATGFLRIGGRQGDPGLRRDLPRSRCPFTGKQAYSDVLIADARNDDNLILGQITVLFHLLHNIVYAKLHKIHPNMSDTQVFSLARKVVTRIYRKIVFKDLLKKLLLPPIYNTYRSLGKAALIDEDDTRMPLEFSHAAARFGHFMVRNEYKINDVLPESRQGVKAMLRQTSAARPFDMPLAAKWLVDWKKLFDESGELKARRFGPEMAPTLVSNDLEVLFGEFNDRTRRETWDMGGLAYRDLIRGAESNLRSAKSIVKKLDEKLDTKKITDKKFDTEKTRSVIEASPFVKRSASAPHFEIDTTAAVKWLGSGPPEYIDCIKGDIPLLLLIILEAANTELTAEGIDKGQSLGAIGSVILAECFFREYWRTHAFIEADGDVENALKSVFGKESVASMPQLIAAISRRKHWASSEAKFW